MLNLFVKRHNLSKNDTAPAKYEDFGNGKAVYPTEISCLVFVAEVKL